MASIQAFNPMHPEDCHFHVDDRGGGGGAAEIAAFCENEGAQRAFLNDALAIGHAPAIAAALGLVARMRGMSGVAAVTGIKRQQLYRTLRPGGNPTLETLVRVVGALGYRLSVAPGQDAERGY